MTHEKEMDSVANVAISTTWAPLGDDELAPKFFEAPRGRDQPYSLKAGNPTPIFVIATLGSGSKVAHGNLSPTSPLKLQFDLSSQLPLFRALFSPSTNTRTCELSFDLESYRFDYSLCQADIRQGIWNDLNGPTPAFSSTSSGAILGKRELLAFKLDRIRSAAPAEKGTHYLHLPCYQQEMWRQLQAAESLIFVMHKTNVVHSTLQYLGKLKQMRCIWMSYWCEGSDQLIRLVCDSDYWKFAQEELFTDTPGLRFSKYGEKTPTKPDWLLTSYSTPEKPQYALLPPKMRFHCDLEHETILGASQFWELPSSINNLSWRLKKGLHDTMAGPIAGSRMVYVKVNVRKLVDDEEDFKSIPYGSKIHIQIPSQYLLPMALPTTVVGVTTNCNTSPEFHFAIIADIPDDVIIPISSYGSWEKVPLWLADRESAKIQSRFEVSAFKNWGPHPIPGMFARCNIPAALLCHGPVSDIKFGSPIKLLKTRPSFLPKPSHDTETEEETVSRLEVSVRMLDYFLSLQSLGQSTEMAIRAVFEALANGIFLIDGPKGAGKTQTISCIAFVAAVCGCRVLVASETQVSVKAIVQRLHSIWNNAGMIDWAVPIQPVWYDTCPGLPMPSECMDDQERTLYSLNLLAQGGLLDVAGEKRDHDGAISRMSGDIRVTMNDLRSGKVDAKAEENKDWVKLADLRDALHKNKSLEDGQFAELVRLQILLEKAIFKHRNVVVCTLAECASQSIREGFPQPDILLVDNATSVPEPTLLHGLNLLPRVIVMAGGAAQQPIVHTLRTKTNPYANQIKTSFFKRLEATGHPVLLLEAKPAVPAEVNGVVMSPEEKPEIVADNASISISAAKSTVPLVNGTIPASGVPIPISSSPISPTYDANHSATNADKQR
ncbi:MAG: hypothetical protein MMC33_005151 [Icmadophila ericetorum]|nr:hypothetical protein [Icmadophila ericetorum]